MALRLFPLMPLPRLPQPAPGPGKGTSPGRQPAGIAYRCRVDAASRTGRRGRRAWALVLAVAVAWNLVANLWLPRAVYVPGAAATAALLVAVAVRVGGASAAELGLGRRDLGRGLAWGAAAAAAVAVVLALGAAWPATRGLFEDRRTEGASAAAVLYLALVRVPLGTVLLEETLFRGVLLGLGRRRWSPAAAAAVSSAAFGLWHVLPARQVTSFNPVTEGLADDPATQVLGVAAAVAGTALAGLVFCWLRLRSGSLVAPALAHWATNGLGYALAFVVLGGG
jgi:uncharacterized protein